ncbi:MAG: hypothetical protein Q4B60_00280 [Erysipelotrichaceae bacterium]|nr:hypothetical protein [Erysipelotrichaceae bacterium]
MVFYNLPTRTSCDDGSTDYKWEKYNYFCRATEGFGYGRINDDGYNNSFDLKDIDTIDILAIGSSHLEGFNIPQNKIITELLNERLDKYTTYNIGISEHNLIDCLDNLENALRKYRPTKYVLIETMSVSFYDDQLTNLLNDSRTKYQSYDSGIVGFAQKIPVLRLLAFQLNNLNNSKKVSVNEIVDSRTDEEMFSKVLSKTAEVCREYGVQPIIVYHPILSVNETGIVDNTLHKDKELFDKLCKENNITFIDMTDTFVEYYKENDKLPHGFMNTSIGSGHLNELGHSLIADEIINVIKEMENN